MAGPEPGAPQALLDSFRLLSPEHQAEFIRLIGREANIELFSAFWDALPLPERKPFLRDALYHVTRTVRPILIRETIPIVRSFPELSEEELVGKISAAYEQSLTEVEEGISLREKHNLKQQRDRKSSPETIRRNAEICDLRRQNPKRWTWGALAKKYKRSKPYLRGVVAEAPKWRRLAADLGTN